MAEDENLKRRIHAYVAVGGPLVSIVLLALIALVRPYARQFGLAGLFELPIFLCLIPIACSGLVMRRYMTRQVSLAATISGLVLFFIPLSWIWTPFFFRDWFRVNRLERMGLRQGLIFPFAWPFFSNEYMARRARSLDNEGLIIAYHLPDHTPAAKAVLDREIKTRGLGAELNPDWLSPASRSTVPPNVFHVVSADRYRAMGLRKENVFRVFRVMSFVVIVAAPFLFLLSMSLKRLQPEFFHSSLFGSFSLTSWLPHLMLEPIVVAMWGLIALYVTYVGFGFMILGFYFRNHGGRVLLLRPFGHKNMTLALKKTIWWYIAPFGHVITLSDQNYKPNIVLDFLFRIAGYLRFLLGPLLRPSFRLGSVKTEHTYLMFANSLTKKYRLSLLSLSCGAQAFNVRTTDDWWKACVNLLLNSSDIVVMDISKISAGSVWEIARLTKTGFIKNCIFIVQEAHKRGRRRA